MLQRVLGHQVGAMIAALGFTAASYLITFFVVAEYYRTHLPHFDSVGSYLQMFNLMNVVGAQGLGAGVISGVRWSISWLHPAYALLWSWAPMRGPEWLVSLNFVLMAVAQACIITCLRTFGCSALKQFTLALLPVIPGMFFVWDGGLQDLRRDPQMSLLLVGCLFLSLAYVTAPTPKRAIALGFVVGLTQWSRDNAISMAAIVVVPAVALAFWRAARTRDRLAPIRSGWLPLLTFVLVAGPYYWFTARETVLRYAFIVWGPGEDRLTSLLTFWRAPIEVMLGGTDQYNGTPELGRASAGVFGLITLALAALVALGMVRPRLDRLRRPPSLILTASGAFVAATVILYTTLGLGYGAQYHAMPFMPVAVGLIGILAGCGLALERGPATGWCARGLPVAVIVGAAALLPANAYRMQAAVKDVVGAHEVTAAREAALRIDEIAERRPVAVLWFAGFSRYHINYYLAQQGRDLLVESEALANASGHPINLEQPLRPSDDRAALRTSLDETVRRYAHFVLLSEHHSRYTATSGPWPVQIGRNVVRSLLEDPDFVTVARFQLRGVPFVLLENRKLTRG